jgi:hypothetical protein
MPAPGVIVPAVPGRSPHRVPVAGRRRHRGKPHHPVLHSSPQGCPQWLCHYRRHGFRPCDIRAGLRGFREIPGKRGFRSPGSAGPIEVQARPRCSFLVFAAPVSLCDLRQRRAHTAAIAVSEKSTGPFQGLECHVRIIKPGNLQVSRKVPFFIQNLPGA